MSTEIEQLDATWREMQDALHPLRFDGATVLTVDDAPLVASYDSDGSIAELTGMVRFSMEVSAGSLESMYRQIGNQLAILLERVRALKLEQTGRRVIAEAKAKRMEQVAQRMGA